MIVTQAQVVTYFLIMARMIAIILLTPGLSDKDVFTLFKIVFLLWLSFMLVFSIPLPLTLPGTPLLFFLAVLGEFLVGTIIGFITRIFIVGLTFGGDLMDTQSGLSVASLLDPSTGQTSAIISKFIRTLAILVFFIVNGHHVVMGAMVQSFKVIPIASPTNLLAASDHVIKLGVDIFLAGLQISAPILITIFLVDFGFGLLSRVAPQVNVFQLGFQLKPIVAMFMIIFIMPGMIEIIYYFIEKSAEDLLTVLYLMN